MARPGVRQALEPYRRMRAADGIVKECTTLETAARWRVRSEPVFSGAYIRKWQRSGLARPSNLGETLACIDAISAMADAIGDARLQKTLGGFRLLDPCTPRGVAATQKRTGGRPSSSSRG